MLINFESLLFVRPHHDYVNNFLGKNLVSTSEKICCFYYIGKILQNSTLKYQFYLIMTKSAFIE